MLLNFLLAGKRKKKKEKQKVQSKAQICQIFSSNNNLNWLQRYCIFMPLEQQFISTFWSLVESSAIDVCLFSSEACSKPRTCSNICRKFNQGKLLGPVWYRDSIGIMYKISSYYKITLKYFHHQDPIHHIWH